MFPVDFLAQLPAGTQGEARLTFLTDHSGKRIQIQPGGHTSRQQVADGLGHVAALRFISLEFADSREPVHYLRHPRLGEEY